MDKIIEFIKQAKIYYIASVDGDQPRVRPFSTAEIYDGKLYIQTGKRKEFSNQVHTNPKVELCAFHQGKWLRVSGKIGRR